MPSGPRSRTGPIRQVAGCRRTGSSGILHHVAQNTAQAAVRLLAAEGLVDIRPARGAYVRENADGAGGQDLHAELASLQAALRRSQHELTEAEKTVASLLNRHRTGERAD